jgi:hypothetical protein
MQDVTVLVSCSPIKSHPSIEIVQETIASVRKHFSSAPIWLMHDGVRPEQKNSHAEKYIDYIQNLAAHCVLYERNISLIPFADWHHQARMTVRTLEIVKSPFVLLLEQDTPLLDRPIDWQMLKEAIANDQTYHIRLHYDETIHPEHEHLMCGKLTPNLIKTIQFHNRPALCHREWLEALLRTATKESSRCHCEDVVYTYVAHSPWEVYRCCVYDPEGTGQNMKRSGHTDGRAGEEKYEEIY